MRRKAMFFINIVMALFLVFSSASYAFGTVPVKSITLSKTKITLIIGKTVVLKATVLPTNATKKTVNWSSSNSKIVTVNKNGLVTAVKVGSAVIYAKSFDGKAQAKCAVSVTKAPDPIKIVWYWNEGNIQLPEDSYICKKIKQDLNIQYVHVTPRGTDYEERLQLLLASQDVPDVITSTSTLTSNLIKYGVVIPVEKYLNDKYIPNVIRISKNWDIAVDMLTRADGKVYSIPRTNSDSYTTCPYIRYDWLKNLGLQVPKTLDELREVLIKFTKNDPDKNGKDDTVGTMMNEFGGASVYAMQFGARATWYYRDANGNATQGMYIPRHKDFLKYIKSLIDTGAMDKEIATTKLDQMLDKLKAGKVGYLYTYNDYAHNNDIKKVQPDCDWRPMPPVKGVYDKGVLASNSVIYEQYCISSRCKNIDAVLKLMNYMADDKSTKDKLDFTGTYWTMRWGEKGVNWDVSPDGKLVAGENASDSKIAEKDKAEKWPGIAWRFMSQFDNAALLGLEPNTYKATMEMFSYPRDLADIPNSDLNKRINVEGIIFPQEITKFYDDIYKNKWQEFFYKAILGKVDIDKGWNDFVADAEKAGLKSMNEKVTKILKDEKRMK